MALRSSLKPLGRLLRDTGGNTLAMMAIAIFPLAGLVGGGVDMGRMYLVKARLQQACDAGALAGRKVMGGSTWASNSGAANTAAVQFFEGNFKTDAYGTNTLTKSFTENAGKVTGTAAVTVPMTIMKIFGSRSERLTVVCDAEMRLPNTDIMFVLDTTGSMGNKAISTDTDTKIVTLKKAVKCFYETVARLDTTAVCGTGTGPTGGTGTQTQIRFGFMPYATNVNVGRLLPTAYFANSWPYQSREQITSTETFYTFETPGTPSQTGSTGEADVVQGTWTQHSRTTGGTSTECSNSQPASPAGTSTGTEGPAYDSQTTQSGSTRTTTWKTKEPYSQLRYRNTYTGKNKSAVCLVEKNTTSYNLVRSYQRIDNGTAETRQVFSQWHYGKINTNISGLKNGTSWNANFTLPIGNTGSQRIISWDGCIEERKTVKASSYSPIPSGARDLDIDAVPSQGDADSLWAPALDDLIYVRQFTSDINQINNAEVNSTANYYNNLGPDGFYACPAEANKLQTWTAPTEFEDYVDSLTPSGNTHHDIGMIWGARFMSPTGIFRSENEFTPAGGPIERHMIFMTDGETCTGKYNYTAYGFAYFDRRQTDETQAPTDGCSNASSNGGTLSQQVDARFPALCTAVKNKNITLWVVYFGTSDATTTARMTNCATPGRFFSAADSATLLSTFKTIADQISQLRLTS